jgi:hypothetical protein
MTAGASSPDPGRGPIRPGSRHEGETPLCCGQPISTRSSRVLTQLVQQLGANKCGTHCSFAYSTLACFRRGMSGSAFLQTVRKPSYPVRALTVSPCMA